MGGSWRARVHDLIGDTAPPSQARSALKALMVVVIVGGVLATALETVEGLAARHRGLFWAIEAAVLLVFGVEYVLRLWTAPEGDPGLGTDPWTARLRYLRSPLGVIDLLAVLPGLLGPRMPISPDWLRVLRLARLLKVARYAPGLALFAAVVRNERRPLLAALVVVLVLLVLESGVMYVLERKAQPKAFASIPHAMWWACVTIATIGYGDVYPITPLGKIFAGAVMLIGIAMFAVPAGILASGFAAEIRKRDFVVTWQTVARVPLFAGLDAARIADIARLLKREVVPPKYAIVRRGEPADAMFFVMSGEVEVDVAPHPRRMGHGEYFGEIALLTDTVRTATVTAATECELLVLDVADFRRLLDAHADLKTAVTDVARQRLAGRPGIPAGTTGEGRGGVE
jgi:voltage-gated potassium channel